MAKLLVVALLLLAVVRLPVVHYAGAATAYVDLAMGRQRVMAWGLRLEPSWIYDELLQQRYGVETYVLAGCVISPERSAFGRGYNSVADLALRQRVGESNLKLLWIEAVKHYRAKAARRYRANLAR